MVDYWRYSATGNTFLFFDARSVDHFSTLNKTKVASLCREHQVDGMIFLESAPAHDFHMRYLNADGGEVEMCGNGARSIAHFAHQVLKIKEHKKGVYQFTTHSSEYMAKIQDHYPVKMTELKDEDSINIKDLFPNALASYYVNTGVPHCVYHVSSIDQIDLDRDGRRIRMDKRFIHGTNVNFYEDSQDKIKMRTFERGVERETLSCGTGAVAVALCHYRNSEKVLNQQIYSIEVRGGQLEVSLNKGDDEISRWLAGAIEITDHGQLVL